MVIVTVSLYNNMSVLVALRFLLCQICISSHTSIIVTVVMLLVVLVVDVFVLL